MLSILAFILSPLAFAIPEANFSQVYDLLENRDQFYALNHFTSFDGTKLGYVKFGKVGSKGCVVVAPGRTEAGIKYLELAHDLSEQGYAPIYALDLRGQGFSDRSLEDHDKGDVAAFHNYTYDFAQFVSGVVLRDENCQAPNLHLFAHSLGGAVVVDYLERMRDRSPFKDVVLSSPMLRIAYPEGKSETSVLWETFFACHTPFGPGCEDYIPGGGAYNPQPDFANNSVTSSKPRYDFHRAIQSRWEEIRLGDPTVRWVRESAKIGARVRERADRIEVPLLILSAGKDTVVDTTAYAEFCAVAENCKVLEFPTAQHEILMEQDNIRTSAFEATVKAFSIR